MALTEAQWTQLQQLVHHQVPDPALATELADHLAILAEQAMLQQGLPFDAALAHALQQLSLQEMQHTALAVQAARRRSWPQRALHFSLLLAYAALLSGATFKIMRFPLANELLLWGMALFSLSAWASTWGVRRQLGGHLQATYQVLLWWWLGLGVLGQGVLFLATHSVMGVEIAITGLLLLSLSSALALWRWPQVRAGLHAQPTLLRWHILTPLACLVMVILLLRSGIGQLF